MLRIPAARCRAVRRLQQHRTLIESRDSLKLKSIKELQAMAQAKKLDAAGCTEKQQLIDLLVSTAGEAPKPPPGIRVPLFTKWEARMLCLAAVGAVAYAALYLYRWWEEERRVTELRDRAKGGDVASQVELAVLMMRGEGTAKDEAGAKALLQSAAEAGDARAHCELGGYYCLPGADQDHVLAVHHFRKAAQQQYPDALHNLAILYETGVGVERNEARAHELRKEHVRLTMETLKARMGN
eukprot:Sspe_Gene.66554::Locus_39314_Transcript_1_3_Confidence_0.500_Length_2479::g.66554::m.66554